MARPNLKIIHAVALTHGGHKPTVNATLMLEDFLVFHSYERYQNKEAALIAANTLEDKARHFAKLIGQELEIEDYEDVRTIERRRVR